MAATVRVELSTDCPELQDGLQARMHDPLWLLARQWQFGEFKGEDTGSPAAAQVVIESAPLSRYQPGPASGSNGIQPYSPHALALETLVEGANRLLDELSSGAYSLQVRKSQFEVVDHRNARLSRTTKSLSGGETFLVALSLALSMAEQLAELTGNRSRLESVFLDEGFGSLDQESIDVVANVLDELVGGGRTVGIVTHVRELAERIPVRFEVSKGPETASIVRAGE